MREACSVSPGGKRGPVLEGRFPISEALALERTEDLQKRALTTEQKIVGSPSCWLRNSGSYSLSWLSLSFLKSTIFIKCSLSFRNVFLRLNLSYFSNVEEQWSNRPSKARLWFKEGKLRGTSKRVRVGRLRMALSMQDAQIMGSEPLP